MPPHAVPWCVGTHAHASIERMSTPTWTWPAFAAHQAAVAQKAYANQHNALAQQAHAQQVAASQQQMATQQAAVAQQALQAHRAAALAAGQARAFAAQQHSVAVQQQAVVEQAVASHRIALSAGYGTTAYDPIHYAAHLVPSPNPLAHILAPTLQFMAYDATLSRVTPLSAYGAGSYPSPTIAAPIEVAKYEALQVQSQICPPTRQGNQ